MDGAAYRWFNRLADRTSWAHGTMVAIARYGIVVFAVLLLWAWWQSRSADDPITALAASVWAALASLVGFAAVQLIGNLVERARPSATMPSAHLLIDRTGDFSFPSDHSTAAAAIAVGLVLATRYLRSQVIGNVAVVAAVVLGLSRVYVGAHYPGDVLGGFVLGGLVAWGLARPAMRLLCPVVAGVARSPLAPIVEARC